MNKDAFIVAVVSLWKGSCMDIDGEDFQDLLVKHGLATEVLATAEDCETEEAQEWDVEPGDTMLKYDAELMAMIRAHGLECLHRTNSAICPG